MVGQVQMARYGWLGNDGQVLMVWYGWQGMDD